MPCYSCGESFGFFSKEHGCKNCGFAFCGKCLTKKTQVPKLNNEKHSVCNKCYNILTGKTKPQEDQARYSPPEAYKKRLAALEEKESKGGHGHHKSENKNDKSHKHHPQKYKHLNPAEREIAERLDKLREKPPEQVAAEKVSEKDLAAKLAKLKGENPDIQAGKSKPVYKAPDRRTQQSQIDDLLDEIANEVELDSRLPDPTAEIQARLAKLKGERSEKEDQTCNNAENNLNRSDSREAQPFTHNIGQDKSKLSNAEGRGQDKSKEPCKEGEEISLEEMNKLIEEAASEVEADARKAMEDLQKDKDIMRRLQEIKSRKKEDVNKQDGTPRKEDKGEQSDSDNENEEEMIKRIVKQALEEKKLDEAAAKDGIGFEASGKNEKKSNITTEEEDVDDDDELPYCTLCTEDATIRCHGCDLDLYCNKCWKESHVDFQMEDHETSKYIKPKGKT